MKNNNQPKLSKVNKKAAKYKLEILNSETSNGKSLVLFFPNFYLENRRNHIIQSFEKFHGKWIQQYNQILDESLSSENGSGSSNLRKNDLEDFDIGEFV